MIREVIIATIIATLGSHDGQAWEGGFVSVDCAAQDDDTTAINEALETAYQERLAVMLPPGTCVVSETTSNYMLLNKGVSMFGAGALKSVIVPGPGVGNSADFILFRPPTGSPEFSFTEITGFMIYPSADGTKRGARGLYMIFDAQNNGAKLYIHHLYFAAGNDYSLRIENHPTLNPQGIPSNSLISDNILWDGVSATNIGDSNVFSRNTIRGTSVERAGIRLHVIDGSYGSAGMTSIDNNNIDAMGPAIKILNGRRPQVIFNNIEQSSGGCLTCAVIEISGEAGQVDQPLISGNHIGIFGSSISQYGIGIGNSKNARVTNNDIQSDNARTAAVRIDPASTGAVMGLNTYSPIWWIKEQNASASSLKIQTAPLP